MRRHHSGGMSLDRLVFVPRHAVADSAEASARDPDLGLQHLAHPGAESQVGMTDDRLGDATRAVTARSAHRRDAVDEFDLADRRHLRRAVLAVHRTAFQKDSGDDVVAPADISQQFREQIAAPLRRIPEMMVRVDDRQSRLERRLPRPLRQPRRQLGVVPVSQPAVLAFRIPGHVIPSTALWLLSSSFRRQRESRAAGPTPRRQTLAGQRSRRGAGSRAVSRTSRPRPGSRETGFGQPVSLRLGAPVT
jgi:hypothetical protein